MKINIDKIMQTSYLLLIILMAAGMVANTYYGYEMTNKTLTFIVLGIMLTSSLTNLTSKK